MKSGSKNFTLGPTFSTNPYVVFNEVSPNNGGALANVKVRQALSYGLDQAHLIQDANGAVLSPPLSHILPPGINGAHAASSRLNLHPSNPTNATPMLPPSHPLTPT